MGRSHVCFTGIGERYYRAEITEIFFGSCVQLIEVLINSIQYLLVALSIYCDSTFFAFNILRAVFVCGLPSNFRRSLQASHLPSKHCYGDLQHNSGENGPLQ